MNRRVLLIGIVIPLLVVGVGVMFLLSPDEPSPTASDASVDASPVAAVPDARPAPEAPSPPEPGVTRRAPEAPVEALPEPAAPVDAAADMGTLRIESDVPGAQVFIDRVFIGTAPLTAANVKPGRHQLNVSAEGFEGFADTIDVAPGPREIAVRFREVRLDAAIDVVHRHGVGSCRGRLVATPRGLRYETANRDDGFTAGLLDLDSFQVDYLEKNLRVRVARGRQFNFTDPDGNADRLLVFHRDVERARERLRNGDPPAE